MQPYNRDNESQLLQNLIWERATKDAYKSLLDEIQGHRKDEIKIIKDVCKLMIVGYLLSMASIIVIYLLTK